MTDYYARKLSGRRLQRCYELAAPRLRQYLEAEILHLLERAPAGADLLELGCGYGRVVNRLAVAGLAAAGVDNAPENIRLARELAPPAMDRRYFLMDALHLGFPDSSFDLVCCVQNGICAFGVDQEALLREALRVLRPGGRLLLSSYADAFWPERLAWFEAQASAGLIGSLDHAACGDGVIVCHDGFRSSRMRPQDFAALADRVGLEAGIDEVDGSCLFCELRKPGGR
ncbi:MAG: class I SAM-dependent methyltransferase [Planctomycetes bacterium]|nr:class I SAM-dependent methyltransferase [Planctomycetota bacterium]